MSNVGKAPAGVLARALGGNIFQDMNLAFMNEGSKDSYNVFKHDVRNALEAATVDPASSFSNTSKKNSFNRQLVKVQTKESFLPSEYDHYWEGWQPSGPYQWNDMPDKVKRNLEELFVGSAANAASDELTNGDGTLITGLCPQLRSAAYSQLTTDPTPTQITENTSIAFRAFAAGTGIYAGVALTPSNIFDKLELMIKGQSKSQRKRPGRKFMVGSATADLIKEAQRLELNFKGVDVTEEGIMRYAGFDIIENIDFPENDILLCSMTGSYKTDAIQMGTSMSADWNNLTTARLSPFSREWGMCLTFSLDIFVVRPEEVCYYTDQAVA